MIIPHHERPKPVDNWRKAFLLWPTLFKDPNTGDKYWVWLQTVSRQYRPSLVNHPDLGWIDYKIEHNGKTLVYQEMVYYPS